MIELEFANKKQQEHIEKQIRMLNKKVKKNTTWFKGFSIDKRSKSDIDMDVVESQRMRGCFEASCRLKKVKGG